MAKRFLLLFAPPVKIPRLGELGEEMAPPLGVLYLASALRAAFPDLEVAVIDGLREGYDDTWRAVEDFRPDFLGLSFYTTAAEGAYAMARCTKEAFPYVKIAAGGPHVTALPEEALGTGSIDVVVRGEGERTLVEVTEAWLSGAPWGTVAPRIDGIAWRQDGIAVVNQPRAHITPLDDVATPARDLVDLRRYRGFYLAKQRPETSMVLSRGCPFSCTFCSNMVWKLGRPSVRTRSPDNVVKEFQRLSEDFGIRETFDHADEFNANIPAAMGIASALADRRLGMTWKTQVRAHPLPPDLVAAMARAGCWYVHLGIESGNERTLQGIGKGITLDQVRAACSVLKDHGIRVHGLFMLFNVWEEHGRLCYEGVRETQATLDFVSRLADDRLLDYIGWSVTTPYPGSKLYDIALRHNLIKPDLRGAWSKWLTDDSFVMQLPGVSDADMAHAKSRGSLLRAKLMLRSGHLNLGDLGYVAKKGVKIIINELRAIRGG
ncbi:cobalamin-dependent protein [Candidatus Fermentibacteria bacterium]|nr:cobalamin-dependent protein [Candidatus Fermentibacteria bacterium]